MTQDDNALFERIGILISDCQNHRREAVKMGSVSWNSDTVAADLSALLALARAQGYGADHDWEAMFARVGKHLGEYDVGGELFIMDRDLRALIAAARRSLARAQPEGWRDISSAPRDGTEILVLAKPIARPRPIGAFVTVTGRKFPRTTKSGGTTRTGCRYPPPPRLPHALQSRSGGSRDEPS